MLFNLIVAELEDLELIWEGCLCSLSFCEIVNNFAIGEGLLDILIVEIDDSVSIWERLALHPIVEDHFLFAVLVNSLNLSIVAHVLFNNFLILQSLAMVLFRELKTEVFFIIRCNFTASILIVLISLVLKFLLFLVFIYRPLICAIDHSLISSLNWRRADKVVINLICFLSL